MNNQSSHDLNVEFSKAMDKVELSWNEDLREWRVLALNAAKCCSVANLEITADVYETLPQTTKHGIKGTIVYVLMKACEMVSAKDMDMMFDEYVAFQKLNQKIGVWWQSLAKPIQESIQLRKKIARVN